jgi:hypothetical protein
MNESPKTPDHLDERKKQQQTKKRKPIFRPPRRRSQHELTIERDKTENTREGEGSSIYMMHIYMAILTVAKLNKTIKHQIVY